MRRFPRLLFLAVFFLLEKEVLGFASAPGVYPDDEKNAGNDMEMPRNPYQNGWTGYEFYYEKEPKKDLKSSKPSPMGFQDLQSSSSDRETPEDPQYFSAKGSESSGTPKPPITTTTLAPKITKVPPSTTTQESFENSAREPVEYEQKITRESSKGINAIQKNLGRKARKCCSCCDEKQPVSRNIETKFVQQAVSPSHHLGEAAPVDGFQQNTVGGSAYIQPQAPAQQPPQTVYQQPFQQYQPQYPQSYSYQHPSSGCGCPAPPQNCCPPPQPCCMPTIPCCPPIPCCPQPKICCQPTPVCLPPPTCCSINFQLPTIPICGRACPSCPCRRRVHRARRLKRHSINSNCHQCSTAGEPWKAMVHHREKRAAPGCSSGFSTMSQNSCSTCGASNLRSPRVKRMGCLPCLGRKKRETDHVRVKRMGCLPCLGGGRKKRSLSSGCSQCNSLGHLFNRYKRSLFGCSPCAPQPSCGCQGRKKRSVMVKVVKRAPKTCDATCCDYSRCLNRQKKESLVPF